MRFSGNVAAGVSVVLYGNAGQNFYNYSDPMAFGNVFVNKDSGGLYMYYAVSVTGSLHVSKGAVVVGSSGVVSISQDLYLAPGTELDNAGSITYGGTYTHTGATVSGNIPQKGALVPRHP